MRPITGVHSLERARTSSERVVRRNDYETAFMRNRGLVSRAEQEVLRASRVAIIGAGGVGGGHAITLARMGIGHFRIVDPDCFELANMNRQAGALYSTLGQPKASAIGSMVADIQPGAEIDVVDAALGDDNAHALLDGVDVVVDGLDFFALDARLILYRTARELGIPVVTSGPMGMSATMHVFTRTSMTFERYFDLKPGMSRLQMLASFLVGVAPKMSHRRYTDLRYADIDQEYGPSLAAACMMCAGIASVEVMRILLGRPGSKPAPYYYQFDAYRQRLFRGRLRWGNRGPLQRLKRWIVERYFGGDT